MSSSPLRPILRTGCTSSCRVVVNQTTTPQTRCFSVSARQHASEIITFSKTSNKGLDATLNTIQQKILLPSYLRLEERNRVFRPVYKEKLAQRPISLELDGEIINFRTMDWRQGDIPNTRKSLFEALDQFKTKDWRILPRLLEAVHSNARRRLQPVDHVRIIRRAGYEGQLDKVMQCIEKPRLTGFKLDTLEKLHEVLSFITLEAATPTLNPKRSQHALQSTQTLLALLEKKEHEPQYRSDRQRELAAASFPLKRNPQVIGTALLFAAGAARTKGELAMKRLRESAQDVLNLWPANKGLLDLHTDDAYLDRDRGVWFLNERNKYLLIAAPILKGMELAMALVEPEMAAELKSRHDAVEAEVKAALAHPDVAEGVGRGKYMYTLLFDPEVAKSMQRGPAEEAVVAETEAEMEAEVGEVETPEKQ